jgi:hypothetical protein
MVNARRIRGYGILLAAEPAMRALAKRSAGWRNSMHSLNKAKSMAKSLRAALAEKKIDLPHSACLELVARQHGFKDWNILSARLDHTPGRISGEVTKLPVPQGWYVIGSCVNGITHRLGIAPDDPKTALIESLIDRHKSKDLEDKTGVLAQCVIAEPYYGCRVKLSVDLKTEDADYGTLFFAVKAADRETNLGFDNLLSNDSDGPLRGTRDWTTKTITLDVPSGASILNFGFFLKGYGKVWARNVNLEKTGRAASTVQVRPYDHDEPVNLDFSE